MGTSEDKIHRNCFRRTSPLARVIKTLLFLCGGSQVCHTTQSQGDYSVSRIFAASNNRSETLLSGRTRTTRVTSWHFVAGKILWNTAPEFSLLKRTLYWCGAYCGGNCSDLRTHAVDGAWMSSVSYHSADHSGSSREMFTELCWKQSNTSFA